MRPTQSVRVTYHGEFHVSTIVDDGGSYETRFFRTMPRTYGKCETPEIVRMAVANTTWKDVVSDGIAGVEYDNEAVWSVSRDSALTVHDTFVKILTDFNTGELA